ncbi:hypothetical protein TNCV_2170691 [Trichonephila clavipes]|nr:hypothetical protein TNCV_2170691 [Trichonephila clavipes]
MQTFIFIGEAGLPWKAMGNSGHCGSNPEAPGESLDCCLTTGHDLLEVYLFWLGFAANKAFPLCGHTRMDGNHLFQCTELDEYPTDNIVSRYWEAGCQMIKAFLLDK